jgi:glyoxylase-like metal-dependent hydrolase (beta-lactamase superfamily II)
VWLARVGDGVHRITLPLPWALDHVHCYALEDPEGWTLIDCGLATPETEAGWREALEQLGRPHVRRVVITHFHSDHIGASASLVALTGAEEVVQGMEDRASAEHSFGRRGEELESSEYLRGAGMPEHLIEAWLGSSFVTGTELAAPTRLVEEGDHVEIAGVPFRVLVLRGHADGHIVLHDERDGRLLGGDVLLQRITPNVGSWEHSRPDPLGDYLETLGRLEQLAPRVIYPGHRDLLENAAERAAETRAHHEQRLDNTVAVLRTGAETPYEVSLGLWPRQFGMHERRFALAEGLAHLIRLGLSGRAIEREPGRWQATTPGDSGQDAARTSR